MIDPSLRPFVLSGDSFAITLRTGAQTVASHRVPSLRCVCTVRQPPTPALARCEERACPLALVALSLRNVMKEAPFGGTLWLSPKTGQEGGLVHHVARWVGSQSQAPRRLPDLRSG